MWMDMHTRGSVSECSVLVVCGEANQQDAHHSKRVTDASRGIHTETCEVGIACISQDRSEETCTTKEEGRVQDPLCTASDDHESSRHEQYVPEGIRQRGKEGSCGDGSLCLQQKG